MPFYKGHKLSKGRPKGVPNRRTAMVEETVARLNCDPFEVLILFAKGDWQALGYDSPVYHKEGPEGSVSMGYVITPEIRVQAARDACKYLYPTKKSVEHVKVSPLEGMTPQEKLEALKQAVKLLEGEIGNDHPGGLPRDVKDIGS